MAFTITHAEAQIQALFPQVVIKVEREGTRFEAFAQAQWPYCNETLAFDGDLHDLVGRIREQQAEISERMDAFNRRHSDQADYALAK